MATKEENEAATPSPAASRESPRGHYVAGDAVIERLSRALSGAEDKAAHARFMAAGWRRLAVTADHWRTLFRDKSTGVPFVRLDTKAVEAAARLETERDENASLVNLAMATGLAECERLRNDVEVLDQLRHKHLRRALTAESELARVREAATAYFEDDSVENGHRLRAALGEVKP
jgi:hypothetical protein